MEGQEPFDLAAKLPIRAALAIQQVAALGGRKVRRALEDALEAIERPSVVHRGSSFRGDGS